MSSIDVTIELPRDDTPGELIKGYFTLMRAFGWDLYVTSHFALKDRLGANWFPARISELKDGDPRNWHPNHRFEPQDPGVILRDFVFENDTPYAEVFPRDWQRLTLARKILSTRNVWFHFGDAPTAAHLIEAARNVGAFVEAGGMHIGGRIDRLIARVEDIRSGRLPTLEPTHPAVEREAEAAHEIEAPADLARPSIGGTWIGEIPDVRYRLTRAGDLVHPETMQSVRDRVAGDFREKLRAWTAVEPRGREVWIDADGAIGGFIGASPRLLGYLGDDPAEEIARGFFTPHYYVVEAGAVVDLDTAERLEIPLTKSVADGTSLRVTTYGDVVDVDAPGGVERVATVTPDEWFPGHLG